jgi:hypothetical protein
VIFPKRPFTLISISWLDSTLAFTRIYWNRCTAQRRRTPASTFTTVSKNTETDFFLSFIKMPHLIGTPIKQILSPVTTVISPGWSVTIDTYWVAFTVASAPTGRGSRTSTPNIMTIIAHHLKSQRFQLRTRNEFGVVAVRINTRQ